MLKVFDSLPEDAPQDYRALAALLVPYWQRRNYRGIGIGGGQGAGKSTLSDLIEKAGEILGEKITVLHLDDFYLTKAERRRLAESEYPLFETRGPPGTHDVSLLNSALRALLAGESTEVPVFDKSRDDRVGTVAVDASCDRVVVEGWCVGAIAQRDEELRDPINELEAKQDTQGTWRRLINDHLRNEYRRLGELLHCIVYLQVPSLEAVVRWRLQQENSNPADLRRGKEWVERFVEYFQRITESMLRQAPEYADVVVKLDEDHSVEDLVFANHRDS